MRKDKRVITMNDNGSCLLRIRETLHALSPKEQQLARFILDQPEAAVDMQIEELASACSVSFSTVIRMCKSLNYAGFKELSRALYSDLAPSREESRFEDIHPGDEPDTVMRNICLSSIQAIEQTMAMIDRQELERAVDLLCRVRRVDFYGTGSSGLTAMDAGSKFSRIRKTCIAHADPHSQILTALTLRPEDVAVLISYSGETNDILNLAGEIKKIGATIITLTRCGKNSLSSMADICLCSSSTETLLRSGAMSSRIAQLCVIDTLYASVCSRVFNEVKPYLEQSRAATGRMHRPQGSAPERTF